jgi:DNA-directed RNA polymerase specialized sigma24 family protein
MRIRSALRRDRRAPEVEAEPASQPEPRAAPEPGPKAWNLWELERLAEELNGGPQAEERALLLLHLREFADPSGGLPPEFDRLVRDAFGDALAEPVS